jgi:DNA-binding XRE family transcriptional regulator
MTNQSFAEFKTDKKKLEEEIIILCNNFAQKFGVKIDGIYIKDRIYTHSEPSERILQIKVDVEV